MISPGQEFWTHPAGMLLRQTYPVVEMYMGSAVRSLPIHQLIGADHLSVESSTLVNLKLAVDTAVQFQRGIEFMCHPGLIGTAGRLSLADYTAFLDYVQAYRMANQLEVLTPSGIYAADPDRSRRAELIRGGGHLCGAFRPGHQPRAVGRYCGNDGCH